MIVFTALSTAGQFLILGTTHTNCHAALMNVMSYPLMQHSVQVAFPGIWLVGFQQSAFLQRWSARKVTSVALYFVGRYHVSTAS